MDKGLKTLAENAIRSALEELGEMDYKRPNAEQKVKAASLTILTALQILKIRND